MNNEKNLAIHTLPIVILCIGVFIAGLSISSILRSPSPNSHIYLSTINSSLTSNALKIKQYSDGLASISLNDPKMAQKSPTVPKSVISSGQDLVNAAILDIESGQATASISSTNK